MRELANVRFPQAAACGAYPVQHNHCFLRIVYDTLFERRWDEVLSKDRTPVLYRLSPKQLAQAIQIGEAIIADPVYCHDLDLQSRAYRVRLCN